MADGVLLDQAIIAKAAADFDATAKRIQEMMSKMNGDVTNAIGQTTSGTRSAPARSTSCSVNGPIQVCGPTRLW
jgi:hypothetical protein